MGVEFQIEHIFENIKRKSSPHLIAKMLTENGKIFLSDTSTLDGVPVKSFNMPRSIDDEGNPRFDIYSFELKDKSQVSNFEKEQIVTFL